jgi:hypothetical protein
MIRTAANKANHDGKSLWSDAGSVGRSRYPGRGGRIPFAGIAGQERLRLLRRPLVRSLRRPAARYLHRTAVLRSKPAGRVEFPQGRAIRFFRPEPDLEARRRLDIDPAPAIRQDLCHRRLRQPRPRRHTEFHCRERTRRLGDHGCREPARFTADVSRPVRKPGGAIFSGEPATFASRGR